MCGPHHCLGRGTSAPDSEFLCSLLLRRGRTWLWIRMRPFLAQFSEPVWSGHLPSWADFITTTPVFRFSVHTGRLYANIARSNCPACAPQPVSHLHLSGGQRE